MPANLSWRRRADVWMRWRWAVLRSSSVGMVAPFVVSRLGEDAIWIEAPDQAEGDAGADELHQYEHRRRRRFDPGEGVGERARDRDGGGGGAGGRRETVRAAGPNA